MLTALTDHLRSHRRIVILGFGKEGISFYNFARRHLPRTELIIADRNRVERTLLGDDAPQIFEGDAYLDALELGDLIIKSPGISLAKIGKSESDYPFSSITELFLRFFAAQTIGITGTKGKSTTSSLIYDLLKNSGKKAVLAGNIGCPALDIVEEIDSDTTVVYELSSHQLEHALYSPHIAILMNLYPEHLDYYRDETHYYASKMNIFSHQHEDDIAVYKSHNDVFAVAPYLKAAHRFAFDTCVENADDVLRHEGLCVDLKRLSLTTIHPDTVRVLLIIAKLMHISTETLRQTLDAFIPLPHRMQTLDTPYGFTLVNDSISTIPESTIAALQMADNVQTLMLGGYDRGIDYAPFIKALQNINVEKIILMYETGKKLFDALPQSADIYYCDDLESAVTTAISVTQKGRTCLFSPAAPSFGHFKNFEERGERLMELFTRNKQGANT